MKKFHLSIICFLKEIHENYWQPSWNIAKFSTVWMSPAQWSPEVS